MDYLSVIEKTFLDYSDWVSRKSKVELNMLAGEDDLRGIFYNKLVSRLREAGTDIGKFRKNLYPTDLACSFISPGFIERIGINVSIAYNYAYHGHERKELLYGLGEAFSKIDMSRLSNRFTWELTKIVNSLKEL